MKKLGKKIVVPVTAVNDDKQFLFGIARIHKSTSRGRPTFLSCHNSTFIILWKRSPYLEGLRNNSDSNRHSQSVYIKENVKTGHPNSKGRPSNDNFLSLYVSMMTLNKTVLATIWNSQYKLKWITLSHSGYR